MAYNFAPFQQKVKESEDWLKQEYQGLRTGRATPAILDLVKVESYGTRMPLNQIGGISIEDARTLRITPWDMSQVKSVEKALMESDLGLGVSVDEKGLRVKFPELTAERRDQLVKVARQKLEDARVALRSEREKTWDDIQKKEKEGGMSEDEKFRLKDQMQKIVDEANKRLEEMAEKKEQEIAA
ncbi:MAG TPA: ribosome recycling factor [Candidatus Paceibacterota bacterium]|jgi:ribosome recycling factor|nr:ribosome recycling factor [Candidatus Paceibacterota bacterium]